jgi:hypothetical protein
MWLLLLGTHSASYYLFNHQENYGNFSNYFNSTLESYLVRASMTSVFVLVLAYGSYRKGKKDNLGHLK